ncbi:nitrogenase cofactor biosynthesis protein NifB [Limisalsivibrio acetivorans]|uniref:nitrogenase cofactor biosynthesis protein NifB n=1 Tax=Limisalsivibrio acetivorans TaxID=1304888 RepID=UPI0003B5DAF8|nr:nitrogenase cofactor biosynthesis protein NifB [Limisalsivibrio acetivorans]
MSKVFLNPDEELKKKIETHPCYCADAKHKYARIHLPVAPACNIQCNYCNRKYDCSNESRPGVTSGVITPEEALHRYMSTKKLLPNLSVAGIAGPGDALANPEKTFKTFEMIKGFDPETHLCLSTNGLNLPDYIDEIRELGINHVTVTMNAVDAKTASLMYAWVRTPEGRLTGEEGAAYLLERQKEGIAKLAEAGILVKINTVLTPGKNMEQIPMVSREIRRMGVFIHNVIPLLSKPEYGTAFAKEGVREPSELEVAEVRRLCASEMGGFNKVMHHCKQCRADAAGILGKDLKGSCKEKKMKTASEEVSV